MDRLQYKVLLLVNHIRLRTRIASPQHIDQMLTMSSKGTNGSIGERLPAQRGMTVGLMGTNGECGIEQ